MSKSRQQPIDEDPAKMCLAFELGMRLNELRWLAQAAVRYPKKQFAQDAQQALQPLRMSVRAIVAERHRVKLTRTVDRARQNLLNALRDFTIPGDELIETAARHLVYPVRINET